MSYELYYWPGIQGRGEFVRLALEEAQAPYIDAVRKDGGMEQMQAFLQGETPDTTKPFAPPFLKDGNRVIAHVANILMYLGPKIGLAPADDESRFELNMLQLTVTDMVAEIHDTHHPIATSKYYEDQKEAAKTKTEDFIRNRAPKFLNYFENLYKRNEANSDFIYGDTLTYVDLSLFQLISGLSYAFPSASKGWQRSFPRLSANLERVRERPNIASYLQSDRRVPFNENGIFRRYTELDLV